METQKLMSEKEYSFSDPPDIWQLRSALRAAGFGHIAVDKALEIYSAGLRELEGKENEHNRRSKN